MHCGALHIKRRSFAGVPELTYSHPVQGKPVISIAAGAEHSVAALESGEVFAWGWGRYGNVGDGERADR